MKKTISLIIVFALLILLTGTVNAASTLQSKIDGGEAIITLDQDYTEDITIPSGKDVTINLNGKKLTSATKDTITVELGATLAITGEGEIVSNKKGGSAIFNNGTTTINGGTIRKLLDPTITNKSQCYYNIVNHGQMIINGGLIINEIPYIEADGTSYPSLVENGYYNYTDTDSRTGYVNGVNQANPKLTINTGEFNGGLNTIKNDDGATLEIYSGTFKNNIQVAIFNVNEATINGGTFEVPLGKDKTTVFNRKYDDTNDKGILTVNGGTFNAEYFLEVKGNPGRVKINSGTFNTTKGIVNPKDENNEPRPEAKLTIWGGQFATEVEDRYKAEGMEVVEEDGKYLVGTLYEITVRKVGEGTVELSTTEAVEGQKIIFTATPAKGYRYKLATIEFDMIGGVISDKSFTMAASDGILTVEFEKIPEEEKPSVEDEKDEEDKKDKEDEKDETPKTGSIDVVLVASAIVAVISLAGIVTIKKYTK